MADTGREETQFECFVGRAVKLLSSTRDSHENKIANLFGLIENAKTAGSEISYAAQRDEVEAFNCGTREYIDQLIEELSNDQNQNQISVSAT